MNKPVYLDYNATTPVDDEVVEAMAPYIQRMYGNPSSSYSIGFDNKIAIEKARQQVADLLNANKEEIVFTSGGTESNNMAIKGVAFALKEKGNHIITSLVEHPAVLEVCRYLEASGYRITYLPVDQTGMINPKDVEEAIRKDTILISIMHANNEVGTIQPMKEIAKVAESKNIIFHTDASQSVGKIDTNVTELGVDLLTIAGHKLYAPKGIGALYIKQGVKLENIIHGAGQEKGIRPGTENVMQIVGLGKACEIAGRDLKENNRQMFSMKNRLIDGLTATLCTKIKVNGNQEYCLPNTLSASFKNVEAYTLASIVSKDVFISTGSACHSLATEASPVLKAMQIPVLTAATTVRISTGKHTTIEEIDFAIKVLAKAVQKMQNK